ncbi:UNKNOWN [Stylonychia lemnae]|uniref:Uncharacterized protein n=1 Tax=Stylonychia lemnae TaxID=5949 RepID=A0A078ADH9_STYLE|nr:UNKNOWN [Stylonychia lemnae]|eukprot:CDW80305.1 UNKNOWN [Stylonychia lemnae]
MQSQSKNNIEIFNQSKKILLQIDSETGSYQYEQDGSQIDSDYRDDDEQDINEINQQQINDIQQAVNKLNEDKDNGKIIISKRLARKIQHAGNNYLIENAIQDEINILKSHKQSLPQKNSSSQNSNAGDMKHSEQKFTLNSRKVTRFYDNKYNFEDNLDECLVMDSDDDKQQKAVEIEREIKEQQNTVEHERVKDDVIQVGSSQTNLSETPKIIEPIVENSDILKFEKDISTKMTQLQHHLSISSISESDSDTGQFESSNIDSKAIIVGDLSKSQSDVVADSETKDLKESSKYLSSQAVQEDLRCEDI